MKRTITILSLVALISMSLTTIASTETSQQRNGRYYSNGLDLTTEQRAKMKDINKEYDKKFEDVRNAKLTSNERSEKMNSLRDQKREAIDKILTADQKANSNYRSSNRRNGDYRGTDCWDGESSGHRGWSHRGGRRGYYDCSTDGHMGRYGCYGMHGDFDLTEAQEKQIDALYDKYAKEDGSSAKYREELLKILTSEQRKQYEEYEETCNHNGMRNYNRGGRNHHRGYKGGGCR